MVDPHIYSGTEVYLADGVHAKGDGVEIEPFGAVYLVRFQTGGLDVYESYEWAVYQANRWLTRKLPVRLRLWG